MALQPFTGQLDPTPAAPALQPFTGELDPTPGQGGGTVENIGMGLLRGAKDVVDTGAQLLASGFDKLARTKEGEKVRQMNEAGKAEFEKGYGGSTAASLGRVGGQVLTTLPVGGVLGAGARAAGAVSPRAASTPARVCSSRASRRRSWCACPPLRTDRVSRAQPRWVYTIGASVYGSHASRSTEDRRMGRPVAASTFTTVVVARA